MKAFFCATVEFDARRGVRTKRAHISGIEDFNLDDNLAEQASRYFHKYQPDAGVILTINLTAFSPLELDSSNHTEKLIELWRIERTAGEYYGGMNTNAYINKELAKLGITL